MKNFYLIIWSILITGLPEDVWILWREATYWPLLGLLSPKTISPLHKQSYEEHSQDSSFWIGLPLLKRRPYLDNSGRFLPPPLPSRTPILRGKRALRTRSLKLKERKKKQIKSLLTSDPWMGKWGWVVAASEAVTIAIKMDIITRPVIIHTMQNTRPRRDLGERSP